MQLSSASTGSVVWIVGFVGITFTLYRDNSRKLYDFYTIEAKTE